MTLSYVRLSTRADQPQLMSILDGIDLFPSNMLPAMMAAFLEGDRHDIWMTAVRGDAPVGLVFTQKENLTDGAWNMRAIGVASNVQGQGIGAKLVRAVESHLARVGAQTLVVDTSGADSFEPVRRFYLGQGYEKTGEIPNFWGAGDSKVTYYKTFVGP